MNETQLRPMNLGEILDRTFSLYRSHFRLFVGIMAVPAALAAVGGLIMQIFQEPLLHLQRDDPAEMSAEMVGMMVLLVLGSLLFVLVYWVLYSLALGATTRALTQVLRGGRIAVGEAFGSVSDRMFGLVFLPLVVMVVLVAAALGAGLVLGLVGFAASAISKWIWIPIIIVGSLTIAVFCVWLALAYCVAVPALVVENAGILESMRRSFRLMPGHRLRAFLVLVLMVLIGYAANLILQAPLVVSTIVHSLHGGLPPLWLRALGAVGAGVAGALTGPLLTVGLALLYFDIRVRKESFELGAMGGSAEATGAPETGSSVAPDRLTT